MALGLVGSAQADDADQDRALQALQRGEVLSLSVLMDRVEALRSGHILEVELEPRHGRWVYEVKKLEPGGRIVKLKLDARSGEVLEQKDRAGNRGRP